tara:strand:+ start:1220 stop:2821 length:1602 start_codon:yes stop_codon:yes gene_type:complete
MVHRLLDKQVIILSLLSLLNGDYPAKDELPINMTKEEITRINEIYTMGRDTDPPPFPVRNVAEFERMQGVIIRYPFGISLPLITEISENVIIYCLVSVSEQNTAENLLQNGGVNMNNIEFVLGNTDSYWTRDYGPWWVVDGQRNMSIVDFTYNRPRPNDNDAPLKISNYLNVPYFATDIVHAGGNYMTDGLGIAASSTLVFEENEITSDSVLQIMQSYYGIIDYHLLSDPNNTYIDHIDCWAKYLSSTKVLVREVPANHEQFDEIEEVAAYFSNSMNRWEEFWEVYRVWSPANEPYTNSLILNEKVLVPLTGGSWDGEALDIYQDAMPGYEIIGFTGSWQSTDALHCRIKGLPDLEMLQIFHNPVNDSTAPSESGYEVKVYIDDLSNTGLIEDSIKIFWKPSDTEFWSISQMNRIDIPDSINTHIGWIPVSAFTGNIQYYIQTADSSGRVENHPLAGFHEFLAMPGENPCYAWLLGDLDNTSKIDIFDILILVDIISMGISFGICPSHVADFNGDNVLDGIDIAMLASQIINP